MDSKRIEKISGIVTIGIISFLALFVFIIFMVDIGDISKEDIHFVAYISAILITSSVLFILLLKNKIRGRSVLLSIPLTMIIVFLLLAIFSHWIRTSEGLMLVSPKWLGGFSQWGPPIFHHDPTPCKVAFQLANPSKLGWVFKGVCNFEGFFLFGDSLFLCTLFSWPGFTIWVYSLFGVKLLTESQVSINRVRKHE